MSKYSVLASNFSLILCFHGDVPSAIDDTQLTNHALILLQEVQQSPLALLAQTCSKIGTEEAAGNNPHVAHGIRVINSGQGVGGEIIAPGWVQLSNADSNTAKQVQGIPIAGGQIVQQPQGGLQLIATQGPNGQIAYVAAAAQNQLQAVNMDGQGDGTVVIPSSGQGQFILNQQQQGIPVMMANGQIIRAQVPQNIGSNVVPSNVAFANNLGGNMVNLGGNIVNLGGAGVQSIGAVRPAGNVLQAIQMPQQIQQMPNFIQVPVSVNGQTTLMPVQVAPSMQTVQDLSMAAGGAATLIAGSLPQSQATSATSHTTEASSQSGTKTVTANVAIKPQISSSSAQSSMTPLNVPVVSFPQLQSVNASGQQTITAAAAGANTPSMQLIPLGNGNFVQAMMPSSQTNFLGAGQNVFTLGSLAQSGMSTATVTTASTSTNASPQQQSTVTNVLNQVPQIIQTLNGQNFANIQIGGQNQVLANTQNQLMQAINLSNMKNSQIAVPIQNLQGQGMQAVQNLQSFQVINAQGQVQQIIGTPLPGIQVYTDNIVFNLICTHSTCVC